MTSAFRAGAASFLIVALASGVFLSRVPAVAQGLDELPLHMEDADSSDHPEVRLIISVPREFVGTEIPSEAFTVTENGIVLEATVEAVPSDDLEVVLLLDVSGSMAGGPLAAAQSAALSFIDEMPQGVSVAVVTFADTARVASTFSTDLESTADAVVGLRTEGQTALYDGLVVAGGQFDSGSATRRTVIMLSDGGDTVSGNTLEQALVALLDKNASFYAIELQTPENDPEALDRLAVATQGVVVAATDPAALQEIFEEIAAQLTNQYRLTYQSEAFGPTPVSVSVEVDGTTASTGQILRMPAAPRPVEPQAAATPEPVVEPVLPTVRPGSLVQLSFAEQPLALYLGMILVAAALFGAFFASRGIRQRKKSPLHPSDQGATSATRSTPGLATLADRAVELADRSLQGKRGGRLNGSLEQAGISMRPAEFAVLTLIAGIVGFGVGYIALGVIGGVIAAVLVVLLVRLRVKQKADGRKAAFAEQLPDTLNLMAGSLRAGFGLLQAIDVVAAESPSPTAEEFQRVKVETHLGRDLDDALQAMAIRVGSEDFEWVTEGIRIHREVGGDISEIIDSVNSTIRDRNQIRRRIRALSAEGRISAVILVILPFALALIISLINPGYVSELTDTSTGRMLIAFAIGAMVVGVIWIRRIVTLEF
jgi:tight adherence protein B